MSALGERGWRVCLARRLLAGTFGEYRHARLPVGACQDRIDRCGGGKRDEGGGGINIGYLGGGICRGYVGGGIPLYPAKFDTIVSIPFQKLFTNKTLGTN